MEQYNVTGMSCAACAARVEKAVSAVQGVNTCAVSLLTNSMGVEGTASAAAIIHAVEAAGYGASLKTEEPQETLTDTETPKIRRRLIASVCVLLPLMYLSMGHMWGAPLPSFLADSHVAMGVAQLVLTAVVMVINRKFFISGAKGVWRRAPNMDTLVALGAGAAFVYSTWQLIAMATGQRRADAFYFESAAMILTLITVGKLLEAKSKGRTTNALKSLLQLAPPTATVERDGSEWEVPAEQVQVGDIFIVKPGESIPVDGVILEGETAVNEAALTGESLPVDKTVGDTVTAATLNTSGFLRCRATRVGEDTTLSQIIKMVSDAAATKAPIAKIADKVSGVFVPVVIAVAVVTLAVWLLVGSTFGDALSRGITVLVISCPCALGLATPVAIMVGSGLGAKNGILFKTAAALEETGRIQIVALDKTGTVTKGTPAVTDVLPVNTDATVLLTLAAALETKSEHPLAKAVTAYAAQNSITPAESEGFRALAGHGVTALIDGKTAYGGSVAFIAEQVHVPDEVTAQAETLAGEGKTPLLFAADGVLHGIIAVADTIKPESPQAVKELQDMGIRVVLLTGDNRRTADAIGRQVGVDKVIADVLPDGKEAVIRALSEFGKVAMVGDGINDAPALTRAAIGIAIGAGADVAVDAADVVLMNSTLTDVPAAIRLSRATLRNIHENLFWAFFYNIIGIPLAAGVWIPLTGWTLNPMFGAAAMSLSSFCVVTNALRLNLLKLHSTKRDKKRTPVDLTDVAIPIKEKEPKAMTKTMKIEGMMCPHCEAAVKKALEALDGVQSAAPSHTAGEAVVTLTTEVDDAVLTQAVEDLEYKVLGIE